MKRILLVLACGLMFAGEARPDGGGIFGFDLGLGLLKRRQKSEPPSKLKSLVATLQSDPDEKKRRQAAEELRTFDPRNNPDLFAALISTLQKDPSPAVRLEAAESIGKLKPVHQPAGIAMEQALQTDPDPKVREALKGALWQYHVNGYRTPSGNPLSSQTGEPPLASARPNVPARPTSSAPTPPAESGFRPIVNSVGRGATYNPTPEPPLAKPKASPEPAPAAPSVLPLPLPASSVPDPSIPKVMPSAPIPTPPPANSTPSVPVPPTPTVPVPPPPGK